MRWRFLLTPAADGPRNMALDEALMARASDTGEAVFRVYSWSTPTLSLGRNQRARGGYDLDKARTEGVAFVRRPTGGRALLHHHEITYSATLPLAGAGPSAASDAYAFINEVLLDGLGRLGVPVARATASAAIPPGLRPCFDLPAEHELVVRGRKLVGSAQWRHGGALLQHGSILVRNDQDRIATLMTSAAEASPVTSTLAESLGRDPGPEEFADHVCAALRARTGADVAMLHVDPTLTARANELARSYADDAWTWRR